MDHPTDVDAYLARLDDRGPLDPTIDTLRRLHLAHLTRVPFENLDIHLGRPIVLDERALFDKIVARRRGGFCYELNGLFASLLRRLGYRVTLLSARVVSSRGPVGPEFDHLALLVDLDGARWLADVGFGRSFRQPLSLDDPDHHDLSEGRRYRAVPPAGGGVDWRVEANGDVEYWFTLTPRRLDEFAGMCRFHQTSPESHFTRKPVATLATRDGGRISLVGDTFTEEGGGETIERRLAADELARVLIDRFDLADAAAFAARFTSR